MKLFHLLACLLIPTTIAVASAPEVSNIRAEQQPGTKLIDIYYDVTDPQSSLLTVSIQISSNAGNSWNIPARTLVGDVNFNVTPGANRHIVWNAGADWNRNYTTQGKVRILADNAPTTPPVDTMAFVPAGFSNPGREIYTSAFFMDITEVSKELWDTVYNWAIANGYEFDNPGTATASDHPVVSINWHDAVKWCNARSEKEGLTPTYYTDSGKTTIYRTGIVAIDNNWVKWDANGYRLPTRAEWLKAYWGGNEGSNFFPWPSSGGSWQDHISGSFGNYFSSGDPWDASTENTLATTSVGYYNGNQVPIGVDMANGFGLYDMLGNVSEWCWDRSLSDWYSLVEARDDNSKGPNTGLGRKRAAYGQNFSSRFDWLFIINPTINRTVSTAYSSAFIEDTDAFIWVGFRTVRSH